jgi:lactoylglutathione lyase
MRIRTIVVAAATWLICLTAQASAKEPPAPPEAAILLVALNVSDLQRSLNFYLDVLKMKETRRYTFPGMTEVLVGYGAGQPSVVLVHKESHRAPFDQGDGFSRIGVRASDVRSIVATAKSAGYTVLSEPKEAHGAVLAFIADPDGYRIELVQMPQP